MVTRSAGVDRAPVAMRVPFAPASAADARHRLKSWMREQGGSSSRIEDARVVISELVGNAVRHARPLPDGTIQVAWQATSQGVHLSVTDGGGSTRPHRVNAPSSALAGRGMAIVESLARRWWIEDTRTRCTVHAVLPLV